MRIVIALVGFSGGIFLLWFRKEFASFCIMDQNRLWGFRFGERTTRLTEVVVVVSGLGFVIFGLLALLGAPISGE
jgi:hypothetical protein